MAKKSRYCFAILKVLIVFVSGGCVTGCNSGGSSSSSASSMSTTSTSSTKERLFLGTGEYSAKDNWHGILRFENADSINSVASGASASTTDGTVDVKSSGDSTGVKLNFVHTLFVDESRDEMYVGALFTTSDNHDCAGTSEICGSIAVISKASSMNGNQTVSRHLFGSSTQINQPHGIWVDTTRNILYAANTMSKNVLVWDNASTVTGNTAANRTISSTQMGNPVFVFIDAANNRMFLACMNTPDPAILIYNNASTVDGSKDPDLRVIGSNTRLSEGNNKTTHNVWYDDSKKLMFVGHHTNEVLIFDMSSVNFSSSSDLNLTPRVLKINEQSDDSDQYKWSTYGFFYLASKDRLYVSAGYAAGGSSSGSGGPPQSGSPESAVKVYDGVSSSSVSGLVTPAREIWWSNGATYYPPQPLWVSVF